MMNDDNYVEWLVKRKDPAYAIPLKILMIVLCVLAAFLAMQTIFGIIFLLAAAAGTYFVFLNMSVEYEYLFAEGGLSVDRILGKARRKRVFDCDKEDVQVVAPADSFVLKDYERQGARIKDFSSGRKEAKVYALMYQKGADSFKVLIEPNEKMIGAMRRKGQPDLGDMGIPSRNSCPFLDGSRQVPSFFGLLPGWFKILSSCKWKCL